MLVIGVGGTHTKEEGWPPTHHHSFQQNNNDANDKGVQSFHLIVTSLDQSYDACN
jgi:hypothetical protein